MGSDMPDSPPQWPSPPPPSLPAAAPGAPPQPWGQPPAPYGYAYPYGWAPAAPPRRRTGWIWGCGIAAAAFILLVAGIAVAGYHFYTHRPLADLPRMNGDHLAGDQFSWVNGRTNETLDLRAPDVPGNVEDWYRSHLQTLSGWSLSDADSDGSEHALTFTLSGSHNGSGRITFTGVTSGATEVVVVYSGS